MKGIILAGGSGTRLYPVTQVVSKQLLPVYDKPMVYYPLTTLMLAGIRDILVISTPQDIAAVRRAARRRQPVGHHACSYAVQPKPEGLAQAFIIGKKFIGKDSVALVLGDNLFYGHDLTQPAQECCGAQRSGATIFAYQVTDPQRYGVVRVRREAARRSASRKSRKKPKSRFAVVGLYFYDNRVVKHRREPQALGARRARDHRREPGVPEAWSAQSRDAWPRRRLARHRHARIAA